MCRKKHTLWRYPNERDEARRLQRSGSSRRRRKEADTQDLLSFESCRSSAVDYIDEMSLDSPRKMQDEQECDEGKRRRRVEAGTRRGNGDAGNHSFMDRGGRRPQIP